MRCARIASWPNGLQSSTAPGRPAPAVCPGAAVGGSWMPKSGDCDFPKWNGLMGVDKSGGGCDYRQAPAGRQAPLAKSMGHAKTIARNSLWALADSTLGMVSSFGCSIAVARVMGPDQ